MADPALRQEDLKALEQTRQRLYQLTNNIDSLKSDVQRSNPLPQWSSLQTSASILGNNLKTLTDHLSAHTDLLNRIVVYPATNYPGRTQESLLGQLLRKKLEPQVENWVYEGRALQEAVDGASSVAREEDLEELWNWARDWIGIRVAKYALEEGEDNYTLEERQEGIDGVNTGLRRKFEDNDVSGEEDEDEEMEDGGVEVTTVRSTSEGQVEFGMSELKKSPEGKARSVEDILRLAASGVVLGEGVGGNRQ